MKLEVEIICSGVTKISELNQVINYQSRTRNWESDDPPWTQSAQKIHELLGCVWDSKSKFIYCVTVLQGLAELMWWQWKPVSRQPTTSHTDPPGSQAQDVCQVSLTRESTLLFCHPLTGNSSHVAVSLAQMLTSLSGWSLAVGMGLVCVTLPRRGDRITHSAGRLLSHWERLASSHGAVHFPACVFVCDWLMSSAMLNRLPCLYRSIRSIRKHVH